MVLGKLPPASATWLDTQLAAQQVAISVITRIELLSKLVPAPEFTFLESFVQSVAVLPLNEPAIQPTIRLRQQHRIKLPDATARAHSLPLLTRNTNDFQALFGLAVFNPQEAVVLP